MMDSSAKRCLFCSEDHFPDERRRRRVRTLSAGLEQQLDSHSDASEVSESESESEEEFIPNRKVSKRRKRKSQLKKNLRSPRVFNSQLTIGFTYRKIHEVEFQGLEQGDGKELLKKLGLDDFYVLPVPPLDKKLCDEFLYSFDATSSSGTVKGMVIKLDVDSVTLATKLPGGGVNVCYSKSSEEKAALELMLADTDKETTRGFKAKAHFGRETEVVKQIAMMIAIKLQCRRECFHFVKPEILLALDASLRCGLPINWADYLCKLMLRSVRITSARSMFPFGEWLTKIIQEQLKRQERLAYEGELQKLAGDDNMELNEVYGGMTALEELQEVYGAMTALDADEFVVGLEGGEMVLPQGLEDVQSFVTADGNIEQQGDGEVKPEEVAELKRRLDQVSELVSVLVRVWDPQD